MDQALQREDRLKFLSTLETQIKSKMSENYGSPQLPKKTNTVNYSNISCVKNATTPISIKKSVIVSTAAPHLVTTHRQINKNVILHSKLS